MTAKAKIDTSKLGLEKGPFLLGGKEVMNEAPKLVPEPTASTESTGPTLPQVDYTAPIDQNEADAAAEERGKLIEELG